MCRAQALDASNSFILPSLTKASQGRTVPSSSSSAFSVLQTIIALDNPALGLQHLGRRSDADERSKESLKLAEELLGVEHPETIQVIANRATILLSMNRFNEALPLAEAASAKLDETLGTGHPNSIIAGDNLATVLYASGNEKAARELRYQIFTRSLLTLGHDHHTTRAIFSELEMEFQAKEDYGALATLRDHRLNFHVNMHGEADPRTLRCMNEVLLAHMSAKNWEAAKDVGERLVKNLHPIKDMDDGHFWRAAIQKPSKTYDFLGDYEKGIVLGEETLSIFIERDSMEDGFGLAAARDLSRMYHRVEDWSNAIRCGLLAVQVATKLEGRDAEKTITYKKELATAYWFAGEPQRGFELDIDVYRSCCRQYGEVHPTTVSALLSVCEALGSCKQKGPVLHFYETLATVLALYRDRNPSDEELLANVQHNLDELFRRAPEEWHVDMLEVK